MDYFLQFVLGSLFHCYFLLLNISKLSLEIHPRTSSVKNNWPILICYIFIGTYISGLTFKIKIYRYSLTSVNIQQLNKVSTERSLNLGMEINGSNHGEGRIKLRYG